MKKSKGTVFISNYTIETLDNDTKEMISNQFVDRLVKFTIDYLDKDEKKFLVK